MMPMRTEVSFCNPQVATCRTLVRLWPAQQWANRVLIVGACIHRHPFNSIWVQTLVKALL